MTTLLTKVQLLVFSVVTALAVSYGAINYFDVGSVLSPPYEVKAQFASAGGIYARADVDLLGTKVGTVKRIEPGPGTGTTVVLALEHGTKIPRDVTATIGNKSAIGEQYVELAPRTSGGPVLASGDVIPMKDTSSPIDVSVLLADLDSLAGSIPTDDLRTVMDELSTGLDGVGPTLGHLIENSDRLTRVSLDHVDDLNALIDDARTVLDTQVAKGSTTTAYLASLAGLTTELRRIDGSFDELFVNGVRAGVSVSNLLADNQAALPVLLNQLVAVTTVATDRIPALHKTLVVFPWALELGGTGIRRCGSYDPKTGKPVEATCNYDSKGRPVYSAYLGAQLPESPTDPPYFPCTQGYEGTVKYQPNGIPVKGGARQHVDSPPNLGAGCTAPPTDDRTPNVRGSQNVLPGGADTPRTAPAWGLALYDPASGVVTGPEGSYRFRSDEPPSGPDGLGWLLNNAME